LLCRDNWRRGFNGFWASGRRFLTKQKHAAKATDKECGDNYDDDRREADSGPGRLCTIDLQLVQ
jgi:hypothetical protein